MIVAERRKYTVKTASQAKRIASMLLKEYELDKSINFGLPEIDDRYHIWRVPLINGNVKNKIGEIVIDAKTSLVDEKKSTSKDILEKRLLRKPIKSKKKKKEEYKLSSLRNTIILGDSEEALSNLPAESVDLIFTSPPYFNARPEYSEYLDYQDYLLKMRKVIHASHRVLADGRFFVLNISPVLIRRASRNESSKRIAVPFDFHRLFIEEDYEFIDDIIWQKPEGAGWATGRGRRFAADRNPLQYKPVPVTEYILVYRKKSDKLIDWYIRNYPDKKILRSSKIKDGYEKTNIWKIKPAHSKYHPAIFPTELAEKVIKYYSFKNDVVLDPFAGVGTVGVAALKLKRRFVLVDIDKKYIDIARKQIGKILGKKAKEVMCLNCDPIDIDGFLF